MLRSLLLAAAPWALVLLACADSPTATEPAADPAEVAVPTADAPVSGASPVVIQASAGRRPEVSPTVAIVDAADRLAIGIEDTALRSALQGYLRDVEAYWLGGHALLAKDAVRSSRQVLARIAALQKASADVEAIELALHDATTAIATP